MHLDNSALGITSVCTPRLAAAIYHACLVFAQVGAAQWLPTQNYYFPLEGAAEAAVEEVWQRLLAEDGAQERSVTLPVIYGRSLEVGRCSGSQQTSLLSGYPAPCASMHHVWAFPCCGNTGVHCKREVPRKTLVACVKCKPHRCCFEERKSGALSRYCERRAHEQ